MVIDWEAGTLRNVMITRDYGRCVSSIVVHLLASSLASIGSLSYCYMAILSVLVNLYRSMI